MILKSNKFIACPRLNVAYNIIISSALPFYISVYSENFSLFFTGSSELPEK